jgi:hypothetical protein
MNNVVFTNTALKNTGKQGVLPKDSDGYYTMPVGGLNTWNSSGSWYSHEGAKDLFKSSSSFMRRVSSGCLKGEYGHPKMMPGQSMDDFANRVMQIDEKNVCAHFESIWLDFDKVKDDLGRPVVAIMAKVAPCGPMGPALAKSFENPKEDVCFSIRAFTEDVRINGVQHRNLKEIVVWDFVNEPGINVARKYKAPALESYGEMSFTKADIVASIPKSVSGMAMESAQAPGLRLLRALGWEFDDKAAPSYLKW